MSDTKQQIADNAWLGLGDISKIERKNPFDIMRLEDIGLYSAFFMTRPEYLHYATKVLLNIDLLPVQAAVLEELWVRPFPMLIASRGFSKSFSLAMYALLRCALVPRTKVVIVGAAFRQSKIIFEYMDTIWKNAPILRSICSGKSGPRRDVDRCTMYINDNWAMAIPVGSGEKIKGLRATTILTDEFAAIPPDIYEIVISGFAAVSSTPVLNVKKMSRKKTMSELGIWSRTEEDKYKNISRNQSIISGTADYSFKHYAEYWRRYCSIIKSRGNKRKLCEILGVDEIPEGFNWKDYSVIRIPYELIPKGFMDDSIVTRAKATVHSGVYGCEYGAVFVDDSDGFFKRSLIESCVTSEQNPIREIWFDAKVRGSKNSKFVYGVDPAAEQDNFSIIIIELRGDHNRIVYCWSTNRKDYKSRRRAGITTEDNYYAFCARKIRELMKIFPCERIGCDSQGGGVAIEEAFHDPDKILPGEQLIWHVVDEDKERDSDVQPGLHILELINFANYEWTKEANHGLRKDFEDKALLFPRFDPVTLEISYIEDQKRSKIFEDSNPDKKYSMYDTLEDCVMEIEELKDELSTITVTRTGQGNNARDRWDTPEVKLNDGKKGRIRKDRYSALVIANMLARQIQRAPIPIQYGVIGDFASNIDTNKNRDEPLYTGPDWFKEGIFV